ncbi:hypothetical protein SLEP1_g12479 [Rubroshorea leprosula]|uniref:Uncharacterized protein n=1 Tax=Rubroshorea leprosula TaxID=152421 RepID=A0AAV5ILC5_9ROSI|nr:hypothetical protein SLEP1_g12479 [Rubroshorea leprosula]
MRPDLQIDDGGDVLRAMAATIGEQQLNSLYLNWPENSCAIEKSVHVLEKRRGYLSCRSAQNSYHRAFRNRCELDWVKFGLGKA